jgi:DNA transposition AAA+ family ATPase
MKRFESPWVDTSATQEAREALESLRRSGAVGVMLGDSGRGKTAFLRAYVLETSAGAPGRTPVLLHRAEVVSTPLGLLRGLLGALDIMWEGTTRDAFPVLVAEMRLQGVEMIVVDDAHRLASHSFDLLRGLHERTRVAIALSGPERLRRVLPARCPELAHRVAAVHELLPVEDEDALHVVRESSMAGKRRSFGDWLAISQTLVEASGGNLRRMQQLLEEARRRARAGHRSVTPRLVQQVAAEMPERVIDLPRGA